MTVVPCALPIALPAPPRSTRARTPPPPQLRIHQITLQHLDTAGYLHSLRQATFGHPIAGQHEVCAVRSKNKDSEWYAAEGIYLPRADKKPKADAAAAAEAGGAADGKDEL